ncbi:disintegrin and metalloproteinase domain-containing protein 20-like [Rhineura floridana]|uniref:disintegrin and metalloproteinase domain-containing protein 20-like n=1 Tax=Rhineura floridana TaxID=261503 RepID=UPI002AC8702F|nr:disintegrin and metalloproteinase domain-containing protein 20-like [Rhineura floridana]
MTSNCVWLVPMILWSTLSEPDSQILPWGFRYASYEVTIPRKLTPRYGQQEPQDITYLLKVEGKSHIVQLRQKRGFVPKNFPVFTYSKEGDLQVDNPFIRDDCFYHGFVQGQPSSLVTLSLCSGGLRGLLLLENKTYEIEPVQEYAVFQHVVYQLEQKEVAIHMRCGLTEKEKSRQEAMIQQRPYLSAKTTGGDWWTHSRYVEVAIVVEQKLYIQLGRNQTLIGMRVLEIIHIANTFYEALGVVLSIAGLEIWSEQNLIAIADEMSPLLDNFNTWRKNTLNQHLPNDAGHLFVYKFYGQTAGLAFTATICNSHWASGVESFVGYSVSFFSVLFAHELGHNLGMNHDGEHCSCKQKSCIMAPFPEEVALFSNCSYNDYFKLRNSECLLTPPNPDQLFKLKFCGNKIVEDGEQCDCGSPAQCNSDPCCQSNCMLHSGASCAFGQCCAKCQYLPAGTVCREVTSTCDLPEYCNGTSEWCPEDVYVEDGAPCDTGAHCYHGNCPTHRGQCKMIFGKTATAAPYNCFQVMNARGDRFGNCGLRHGTYKKCKAENILCGQIQCANVQKLHSLEEHRTIIQTLLSSTQCWGTDYHSGMESPNAGAVRDGTPCGNDMMCINRECTSVSFKYYCNVTKCHNRGICNNHKNCHCDYGWAPPDCLKKGYGGSIDSGPVSQDTSTIFVGTIVGTVFVISAAIGLTLFYRAILLQELRRLISNIYPTKSMQEASTW